MHRRQGLLLGCSDFWRWCFVSKIVSRQEKLKVFFNKGVCVCIYRPTERERTERLIKMRLREIMMQKDLENVTCKEVRHRVKFAFRFALHLCFVNAGFSTRYECKFSPFAHPGLLFAAHLALSHKSEALSASHSTSLTCCHLLSDPNRAGDADGV